MGNRTPGIQMIDGDWYYLHEDLKTITPIINKSWIENLLNNIESKTEDGDHKIDNLI